MSTHFRITVRWIGDRFHGFVDGTESIEWPPSPFRLFQALVASAHRHGMTEGRRQALAWLERQQSAPELLAVSDPPTGLTFDHWVPDNDNLVDHRKGSIRKFKPILHGDRPVVHYVWSIDPMDQPPIDALDDLAATLGWLGWAIDSAYAIATLATVEVFDVENLPKNPLCRFHPLVRTTRTDSSLRVPKPGSTAELERLHSVNRIAFSDQTQRRKKKWPKVFDRFFYTSPDRSVSRPYAVFKLLDLNEDPSRYPHAKLIHIAGMMRHVAIERMKNDPPPWKRDDPAWVERFVCGHRGDAEQHQQISYVPLPSIGEHADAMIRNIMLIAPIGCERELEYVAERMADEELKPEDQVRSIGLCKSQPTLGPKFLERVIPPGGKFIAERYLGRSNIWHTVTPVILPGYDDHRAEKTIKLIQRALAQSGVEQPCEFEWSTLPNFKNCLTAHKYDRNKRRIGYYRPDHLKDYTAVHLRIRFEWPYTGPLAIGAGRHCGLGLFAALDGIAFPPRARRW